MSDAKKGAVFSEEHRRNLGAVRRGATVDPESVKKRLATIEANGGLSDEAREKIANAAKRLHTGKKRSPETIAKMAEARRLYWEKKRADKVEV